MRQRLSYILALFIAVLTLILAAIFAWVQSSSLMLGA